MIDENIKNLKQIRFIESEVFTICLLILKDIL